MLEFRDIEITDKKQINDALAQSDFMGCEYSFANNMAWKRLSDSKISFYKDFYICGAFGSDDGVPHFIFPAGKGDYQDVFSELKRFTDSIGKSFDPDPELQKSRSHFLMNFSLIVSPVNLIVTTQTISIIRPILFSSEEKNITPKEIILQDSANTNTIITLFPKRISTTASVSAL